MNTKHGDGRDTRENKSAVFTVRQVDIWPKTLRTTVIVDETRSHTVAASTTENPDNSDETAIGHPT